MLYAIWSLVPTYTITYDANSATIGTVPTDGTRYTTGAIATLLPNSGSLIKTNYEFWGWNTKTDGSGTHYAASTTSCLNIQSENVVLYAEWHNLPTYNITYDVNKPRGTEYIRSIGIAGTSVTLADGNTFGWYNESLYLLGWKWLQYKM